MFWLDNVKNAERPTNILNKRWMKKAFYAVGVIVLTACAATGSSSDKAYSKAKTISVYSGNANELQDGTLVLKEGGYFSFYLQTWFLLSTKHSGVVGRYTQRNDTIHLNWLTADPKKIKPYLSDICVIDPVSRNLWFVDTVTHQRLWELRLQPNK